jgi:multidrug efflux pump subunit AcrB
VRALAERSCRGHGIRFAGRAETFGDGRHASSFALAVLLTYLVLAFQFESSRSRSPS